MDESKRQILKEEIENIFLNKTLLTLRAQAMVKSIEIMPRFSDKALQSEVDGIIDEVLLSYSMGNNQSKKPKKCIFGFHNWKYLEPRANKITWRVCVGCHGRQRGKNFDDQTWWDWA